MFGLIMAFLFWASIPVSVILGSWTPFGFGLLALVVSFTVTLFRVLRAAKRVNDIQIIQGPRKPNE